jgi:hypothetical protein
MAQGVEVTFDKIGYEGAARFEKYRYNIPRSIKSLPIHIFPEVLSPFPFIYSQ